jgi:succinate dehydrogenase assembly factor 2
MSRVGSLFGMTARACNAACWAKNQRLTVVTPHWARLASNQPPVDPPQGDQTTEPWIPEYIEKFEEPIADKRARLVYQSRKRGMLENGLLLGSFAKLFLPAMDEEKLALYDRIINLPTNDWEIYYWATETKPTPEEFDNVVMDMLKAHAKNENRESRVTLPDL